MGLNVAPNSTGEEETHPGLCDRIAHTVQPMLCLSPSLFNAGRIAFMVSQFWGVLHSLKSHTEGNFYRNAPDPPPGTDLTANPP